MLGVRFWPEVDAMDAARPSWLEYSFIVLWPDSGLLFGIMRPLIVCE